MRIIAKEQFQRGAAQNKRPTGPLAAARVVKAEPASTDAGDRRLTFTLSTGEIDRAGDRINPAGWKLDQYLRNPIVLWMHNWTMPPIAKTTEISVKDGTLVATAEFPTAEASTLGDQTYQLLRDGFLSACSVGFFPRKYTIVKREDGRTGIDYEEVELFEWSAVTIGCNDAAQVQRRRQSRKLASLETEIEILRRRLNALGI